MARAAKWILVGLGLALAAGFTACRLFWPESFAVNAPLTQLLFGTGIDPDASTVARRLRAAEGFGINPFARVPDVRGLAITSAGDLLVTTPRSGAVRLVLADRDDDGISDGQRVLLEELNRPHGLALRDGWLYVGETDAVLRVGFDAATGSITGTPERIVTGLPAGGNHWTRTLRFGPDGLLYLSVGSSCNVCVEEDERRAAMLRFQPDGSGYELFATGLRNAVGFDWRPESGELYATDNGRDLLGDDFPPCELNRVVKGGFYGWPYANGDRVPDPDLGAEGADRISSSVPPAHGFQAHNAPLGIHFVRSPDAPPGLQGAALVALHGSWNRTRKDGYKVVSLHWQPDGGIIERDFIWGFLEDEDVIGRPVEIAEATDGSFYLTDDLGGQVYRIAAGTQEQASALPAASNTTTPATLAIFAPAEREAARARGRVLYETHSCAGCHEAARADPGVVVVPLQGLTERHDLDSLVALLETPTPPMPVAELDDAERRDLAGYLLAAPAR